VGLSPAGVPDALVVARIALSVVLVVAAGLFVLTLTSLASRDLGFVRDSIAFRLNAAEVLRHG
jgi:hypothetical protein